MRIKIREKAGQAIRLLGAYLTEEAVFCVKCLQDVCYLSLVSVAQQARKSGNPLWITACDLHVSNGLIEQAEHPEREAVAVFYLGVTYRLLLQLDVTMYGV